VREKALLTLGFATGFRISELLSLTIADVVNIANVSNAPNSAPIGNQNPIITPFTHVTVKAANTKTKVGRTVLLNSDAKKAIKQLVGHHLASNPEATLQDVLHIHLFNSNKTKNNTNLAMCRQQAHRIIKALFARIQEFGNVSTHTMRKTFAKAIYDATKKLELVQIALGHKSITSTISYLAFDSVEVDSAIMAMEF
jgi:site-specific recombinase XerD